MPCYYLRKSKILNPKNNIKMSKLTIDLDKWQTQQQKAECTPKKDGTGNISVQYVSKLIRLGKLKSLPIPELKIVLVER
jgi:hypothetical protein